MSGAARFCTRCGAPVGELQGFCTRCGVELRPPAVGGPPAAVGGPAVAAAGPPPRRRPPWVPVAVALGSVVVLAVAGVAIAMSRDDDDVPTAATTSLAAKPPVRSSTVGTTPTSPSVATGSDPPTAPASAAQQAAAVDALLTDSATARADVMSAIADITNCRDSPADVDREVGQLQGAIATRRDVLDRLATTTIDSLPDAAALRTDLENAWTASIEADQDYAAWAQTHAHCDGGGDDPNRQAGDAVSTRSRAAKTDFVARWNPVAASYGLVARDPALI